MNPNFRDMLAALCEENAEFLLVGAYAMTVYGLPRATGDMDIWVRPTPENAQRVWNALKRFRAPLFTLKVADLQDPDVVFQMGVAPFRIDLLTSISGVGFEDAWSRRSDVAISGLVIPVLSRADLITNKRAAGRPKDIADAAWLESDIDGGVNDE